MTRFLRLGFVFMVGVLVSVSATVNPDRPLLHDSRNTLALRNGYVKTWRVYSTSLEAQERITLTAPEAVPNNLTYRTDRITITEDDPNTVPDEGTIVIQLMGVERPSAVTCVYNAASSPTGTFLITGLNKANLSSVYAGNATTGSLKQRIFHRLVVMNEAPAVCGRSLVGSLTGTPQ